MKPLLAFVSPGPTDVLAAGLQRMQVAAGAPGAYQGPHVGEVRARVCARVLDEKRGDEAPERLASSSGTTSSPLGSRRPRPRGSAGAATAIAPSSPTPSEQPRPGSGGAPEAASAGPH